MAVNSFLNRCFFAATSSGTGDFVVSAAISGYMTPAQAGAVDAATYGYFAQSTDLSQWEVGVGTYTVSSTTLARTTVLKSSNSNSKVSFSAAPNVGLTPVAADLANTVVKIDQVTTTGSQATVDFQNIPAGFTSLRVVISAQDTHTGTSVQVVFCKVNNDGTSGNYTSHERAGAGNGSADNGLIAPTSSGFACVVIPQAGNTSYVNASEIVFTAYSQTTFFKAFVGTSYGFAGDSSRAYALGATWKSTAAINRLTFSTDGTAFTNGSIITLYGMP